MQSFCRLREHVIENLKRANNLVKNVATRKHLKELIASKWDNMTAIIFHEISHFISR